MKFIHSLPAVLVLLMVCSCSVETIDSVTGQEPVNVSAYCAPSTRVPLTGTVFPTTRNLAMAAYHNAAQGSSANYFKDVTFTYSNEGTIWQCGKYWPLNGSLDFLGYSLDDNSRVSSVTWDSANYTSGVTMTLADNHANQDDLLVGGSSANTASSSVMALKHAESYLTFQAKANVAYNATTNFGITITDIKVNNAYYSGTVACTRSGGDMSFTWSDRGAQQASMSLPSIASTNLTTSYANIAGTPGVLVVPQDQTSITVYYTIHNGKDDNNNAINNPMQHTYTPASGAKWDPMKKYIYRIDMTLTGITVSVSVTDWVDQTATPVPIPA